MHSELVSGAGEVEYEVTIIRREKKLEKVRNWLKRTDDGPYEYVDAERIQIDETHVFKQRLPEVDIRSVIAAINGLGMGVR